jgi:uncharacterized repeat protein (TIGR01451 family)
MLGALRWNVGSVDLTFGAGGGLDDGKNAATFRLVFGVTSARAIAPPAPAAARPAPAPGFAGPAQLANSRKTYVVEDWDRNGQVSPGDIIVYTITIVNTGSAPIEGVAVTDPVPANTDYVPNSLSVNGLPLADAAAYQPSHSQIVARVASIPAGPGSNQALISFKTKIRAGVGTATTLRNEARIRADGIPEFVLPSVDTAVFPAGAQREKVVQTTRTTEGQQKLEVTESIQFRPNGAEILPASYPVLDQVASILREQPALRIKIVGHTDSEGDANANVTLSQKRADAVRRYLVDKGIAGSRLQSEGHGEIEPVASNATEAGRAANRRVEFVVVGGG